MDLFGRSFINNYTNTFADKKELNDFLHDVKNNILILQEENKVIIDNLNKNNNLIILSNGILTSILIYIHFFS